MVSSRRAAPAATSRPWALRALIGLVRVVPAPAYQWLKRLPVVRPLVRKALDRLVPAGEMTVTRIEAGPLAGAVMALQPRLNKEMIVGHYEIEVVRTVQRHLRPGARAFDVGAHLGYMSLVMAKAVGPDGQVVSFEPDPTNHRHLSDNVAGNPQLTERVSVVAAAVGRECGSMAFAGGETTGVGHLVDDDGDFAVEVVTLDEAARRYGTPDLVKMDIEGRELDAVQGATDVLREGRTTMLIEAHSRELEVACRSVMESFGYSVDTLRRSAGQPHLLCIPPGQAAGGPAPVGTA